MKKYRWMSGLMLGAMVLAACGGDTDDTAADEDGAADGSDEEEEAAIEEDDNTLVIGTGTDMVTFDIHDHNATNTEAIHVNMFNYLVRRDGDDGFEGDLAESFENVDDTTWHFTLHEGVTFHNGDELTAEDVKYTFDRVASDDTLMEHSNYRQIQEVNVLGDYEFEIITDGPEPALLNRISRIGSGILPADYIEEEGWDHFLSNPVGTGPFQFAEWNRDESIVLERYDDYFGGDVTEWEEVVFRVIPETSTRVNELLTGGVHIAENVPPAEWDRVNDNDGTSIISGPSNRVMLLILNQAEEYATSDKRVRQAIDLAIDNEAITEHLLGGEGTPVQSRVTPGNTGAHPDLFDSYNHDPDQARELLEEAGYGDGLEITFNSPQGRYMMDSEVAELIRGMLSEVGITANLEFLEWSNFADMHANNNNEEMYFLGLGNSMFDAALGMDTFSAQGTARTGYVNDELDELLQAAAVNMDAEEREQQYHQAQEIVAEDLPYVFLYQAESMAGVSDSINYEIAFDETIYVENIEKN
ncbi:peptide ABC transporter substrate-binding protein [Alteribacter lacisalsi]|uniref:Peptide ABC transporter substrate-binding protein n=1 Tax=Alteribacter lacisalsi TaxID=2045244 RepID=A0A2W0HB39_9BACI|nr:ABC transporter substrate-binding protein [Alteribacter lacisalsi]PYZ99083.1 peptide ABC transporter substrate-binding protein [Alteribacter lacisalsi]